jgi:hypothetical protein
MSKLQIAMPTVDVSGKVPEMKSTLPTAMVHYRSKTTGKAKIQPEQAAETWTLAAKGDLLEFRL